MIDITRNDIVLGRKTHFRFFFEWIGFDGDWDSPAFILELWFTFEKKNATQK